MKSRSKQDKLARTEKIRGFTIIEVLVVATLFILITALSIRNLSSSRLDLVKIANGIVSDIRLAQLYSLSSKNFNNMFRCGYGIHRMSNVSYVLYAGRDAPANNCQSNFNYNRNHNPTVKTAVLDPRVEFLVFDDIFFRPPDPIVYINESNNRNQGPELITIRKLLAYKAPPYDCTNQDNCIHICVYFSGEIEIYRDPSFCQSPSIRLAPTANISCSPCTIPYNTSSTISWTSSNATSCSVSPGGGSGTSGSQQTGNLTSNTTYTLTCSNSNGSTQNSKIVTVLPPPPPTMVTSPASNITINSATLNGTGNPNGLSTNDAWFRYSSINSGSCNDTFGTRAPSSGGPNLGNGTSPVGYSRNISGLLQNTTYYYCAIARNASGLGYGAIVSFTTAINFGSFSVDSGGTLTNRLSAYWKLDETSGTRFDSAGTSDLNPTSPVSFNLSGISGNAVEFDSDGYISIADNPALSVNGSFTVAGWFYLDTTNRYRWMISKWLTGGDPNGEYVLWYRSDTRRFVWSVKDSSGAQGDVTANNFGAPTAGNWYFIVAIHDTANQRIRIQVNNTSPNNLSWSTGIRNGANDFKISHDLTFNADPWDGRIDEVGIWQRSLTTTERNNLWNNGNGNTIIPQAFATGGTVNQVGRYRTHTFTSSDILSVSEGGTMEYLVVGGGGGGGQSDNGSGQGGGGGGAGGVLAGSINVGVGNIPISIGGGGAGGSGGSSGGNGDNSSLGVLITAIGGGGGSTGSNGSAPGSGGSGGGGARGVGGGTGTAGQGNNGGNSSGNINAAGGGGANSAGGNSSGSIAGSGGAGSVSNISGSNITYGGGGGGGSGGGVSAGGGGSGGGGAGGATATIGSAGATNRGAGGGGGGGNTGDSSVRIGGSGGSGIIIIRYLYTP